MRFTGLFFLQDGKGVYFVGAKYIAGAINILIYIKNIKKIT
jgi:hypothetical protein